MENNEHEYIVTVFTKNVRKFFFYLYLRYAFIGVYSTEVISSELWIICFWFSCEKRALTAQRTHMYYYKIHWLLLQLHICVGGVFRFVTMHIYIYIIFIINTYTYSTRAQNLSKLQNCTMCSLYIGIPIPMYWEYRMEYFHETAPRRVIVRLNFLVTYIHSYG